MVVSRNGVLHAQQPLEFASGADVVLFGSGSRTLEMVSDPAVMARRLPLVTLPGHVGDLLAARRDRGVVTGPEVR